MNLFEEPVKVALLFKGFKKPWFIAGGWALDLYLGRVTRTHKDLEIAIFRHDQIALQNYLTDWKLKKIIPDSRGFFTTKPWKKGEWLELPVHEISACRKKSYSAKPERLEILFNESYKKEWKFRRNTNIVLPLTKLGLLSEKRIPYLNPEIVLLFKAKSLTDYDEADFKTVYRVLSEESRKWLMQAIKTCYPAHPWLTKCVRGTRHPIKN